MTGFVDSAFVFATVLASTSVGGSLGAWAGFRGMEILRGRPVLRMAALHIIPVIGACAGFFAGAVVAEAYVKEPARPSQLVLAQDEVLKTKGFDVEAVGIGGYTVIKTYAPVKEERRPTKAERLLRDLTVLPNRAPR